MKLRRLVAVTLAVMLVLCYALTPVEADAASRYKKSTLYTMCIKSGDYVYCTSNYHIYKVKLSTRKVTRIARYKYGRICNFKRLGDYLYFAEMLDGPWNGAIGRINLKTGKKSYLAKNAYGFYSINQKKIYYEYSKLEESPEGEVKSGHRVMNLDGSSKKKTKYEANPVTKKSNKRGYKVQSDFDFENYDWENTPKVNYYLKTPSGRIWLGKDDPDFI